MTKLRSAGQVGYEAYATYTGGKTFDGRSMPTWDEVEASGTKVAGAWEAAAAAVLDIRASVVMVRTWGIRLSHAQYDDVYEITEETAKTVIAGFGGRNDPLP